jgi:hypothetical protein
VEGEMICSKCGIRYADFPESDFKFVNGGLLPNAKDADEKRLKVFESNEIGYCGCMEED